MPTLAPGPSRGPRCLFLLLYNNFLSMYICNDDLLMNLSLFLSFDDNSCIITRSRNVTEHLFASETPLMAIVLVSVGPQVDVLESPASTRWSSSKLAAYHQNPSLTTDHPNYPVFWFIKLPTRGSPFVVLVRVGEWLSPISRSGGAD